MLRILFSFSALSLFCSGLLAQTSVWKVTKDDAAIYIGGTCHILRAKDFPLPREFDLAYSKSDSLILEIDPAVAEDPQFAAMLMQKAMYTDGRTLKSVLSEEAYSKLAAYAKESGTPLELFNGMKPGMVVMMVVMQELAKVGVSLEGVDMHYAKRAKKDGKTIGELETAESQLDILLESAEGKESEFVLYSLKDLDQLETMFDQLITIWRKGDLEGLDRIFLKEIKAYPEIYEEFLVQRNRNWIPKIEAMFKTPETEFVLFGVGHAPGENGVLAMLKERGYRIEQVVAE